MTMEPVRVLRPTGPEDLRDKEWLVANGLGGYACGPLAGRPTRRYHGPLVAALPAPLGRMMMLNDLVETFGGGDPAVVEFRLEWGLPVWRLAVEGRVIEKRLVMPHQQNTTLIQYRLVDGAGPLMLALEPWFQFRGHDRQVHEEVAGPFTVCAEEGRFEVQAHGLPPTRLALRGDGAAFALTGGRDIEAFYRQEEERAYTCRGHLWSPGVLRAELTAARAVELVVSTEDWHVALALSADEAWDFEIGRRQRLVGGAHPSLRQGAAAELVVAADSFVIVPIARIAERVRAQSQGQDIRAIIAGYHWFAVWGRDTMIALEGLLLSTGRFDEARWVLETFAGHVRHGLIPNDFPDQAVGGQYNTADATMWFFHAVDRYVSVTGDRALLRRLLPVLADILDHHRRGTLFGIGMDPDDGLLRQGAEGVQLTWMDAVVDGWVVTPRRGKAVEINALWYNALAVMAEWLEAEGDLAGARAARTDAERAKASFNRRFWSERAGHLYDVVDTEGPDDDTCRPNQLFAVALPRPVLDPARWAAVVDTIHRRGMVTPVGLRSLPPDSPDYQPSFFGDQRARDSAYHRGTIWAWLIGPFLDAWLRVHPGDTAFARRCLEGFLPHLDAFGVGSIAEVFDADPPYTPRGCVSQAWSVAEWLRAWVRSA